jgi:tetratricopeptide (TPR) repeat protein
VGSTELRSRLGEDAAEDIRRDHDRLVAEAIAASRGQLVKNLGDGVMATFAGASDAVAAAVRIQQVLDRQNRASAGGTPLGIRIGISAGDVTFEEADCFGTPVIEAARLCAAASGGQILVTEIVRLLAGSGSGREFTPVGPLELKGLPALVSAHEVAWEPLPVASIPLPALLTDVGRIFVGREEPLDRLGQLWKEAAAGERRVALLAGEPGVGKTRLVAELAGRVHEEGATLLAGRCDEDLGVPYQPFVEALRHFVDHSVADQLGERLGRYGGELVRLLPELAERVPDLAPPLRSDPETERYRLFDAVAVWLGAASAREPVLLVLDDLQWAAKPTLLLLRHVVRAAEPTRLLIVGTYRDTELDQDHPLLEILADLRRQAGVERLSLTGLDHSGVVAFVTQASGQALTDEAVSLARAIHVETEGNPFFVREVLRHLAETGAIERRGEAWSTRLPIEDVGIPEGVREVVGKRLARLSGKANSVLRTAAVVGAEFEPELVRVTGGFDEEELISALEEAITARLVIESAGGRYRFAHALVRDTLYKGLSGVRRVALHRRVAESIETIYGGALDDHLPALAHHWDRAAAPAAATEKAVAYAKRAGDRALAQLANDEAVTYYQQALERVDSGQPAVDSRPRLDLLLGLGVAQQRTGDPAHRQTLLEAARLAIDVGDADRLAEAALANGRGLWSYTLGVDAERVGMLEAALAAIPGDDSPTRARLLARLGQEVIFGPGSERHHRLTADGVAMARRLGDRAALGDALAARANAIFHDPPFSEEWVADSAELLALAGDLADPGLRAYAAWQRFAAAFQAGMVDAADEALVEQERAVAESGQPVNRWLLGLCRTGRLLAAGRIADAERSMNEVLDVGLASGQPDARMFHASTRFELLFETGRLHEDLDRLVLAVENSQRLVLRAMLALTYSELGRDDDARRLLEPVLADLPGLPRAGGVWFRTVVPAALACCGVGDPRLAEAAFEFLLPCASLITGTIVAWSGSGSHHLGMLATTLGRLDEADRFFAVADATHATIPAPVWLARTRLEWARMLLSRRQPGDADRAGELLGQALTSARELGRPNLERRAVELLSSP